MKGRKATTNASSSSIPDNTFNLEAITTGTVEALNDMDKIANSAGRAQLPSVSGARESKISQGPLVPDRFKAREAVRKV